jgi:hypothetical protein
MAGIEGRTLEVTLRAVNETDFWAETGILDTSKRSSRRETTS